MKKSLLFRALSLVLLGMFLVATGSQSYGEPCKVFKTEQCSVKAAPEHSIFILKAPTLESDQVYAFDIPVRKNFESVYLYPIGTRSGNYRLLDGADYAFPNRVI